MSEVMIRSLADPAYWVQCVCAAIFSYIVFTEKEEWRKKLFSLAGGVLFLILSFFLIHLGLSALAIKYHRIAGIGTWFSYLGGVAAFAALFTVYEKRVKLVIAAVTFSTIITVFELGAVLGKFLEVRWSGFDSLYSKIAASFLLLLAGHVLSRYRVARDYVSVHAAYLNLTACVASAAIVVVFDLFNVHVFKEEGDTSVSGMMSVVFLALYIINTVCYLMTYHLGREHTNILDLTAEAQMNKSAASLLAITEGNLAELHTIRHDIENHFTYMRTMIDSGDCEGVSNYLDELTGSFSMPLVPIVDCGNHVMNLIFNMENAKARELEVSLDIKALIPHVLPFDELDLVKLYTNIIDNAMEACAAEEILDPAVFITVNIVGEYLFTRIVNPTKKQKDFLESGVSTTKRDMRMHGRGISIVREIVKKYGGSIRYSIENGEFTVEFMLCLKEVTNG